MIYIQFEIKFPVRKKKNILSLFQNDRPLIWKTTISTHLAICFQNINILKVTFNYYYMNYIFQILTPLSILIYNHNNIVCLSRYIISILGFRTGGPFLYCQQNFNYMYTCMYVLTISVIGGGNKIKKNIRTYHN